MLEDELSVIGFQWTAVVCLIECGVGSVAGDFVHHAFCMCEKLFMFVDCECELTVVRTNRIVVGQRYQ